MAEVIDVLLRARMEASGVEAEVGRIQKSLKDLTLPKGVSDELEKSFSKLGPLLKDYQKQLNKGFSTQKDLKNFNLLKEKIDDVFGDIKTQIGQVNGQEIRLKADTQAITKLEKEMDNLQNKLSDKMGNIFKKGQTEAGIKGSIKELQNALNIKFDSGALKLPALSKLVPDISKAFNTKDFASFNNQLQNLQNRITQLSTSRKFDIAQQLGFKGAKDDIKGIEKTITDFFNKLQVNKTSANAIQHLREQIKGLESELGKTKADALNNALKELEGASGGIDQLKAALDGVQESSTSAATSMLSMKDQVSQLQQSTQYFFSLRNMINLLKRGINEAVDVVKELDAAMTQTAVVTDFSVGDMWEKLPEYTANANALGASVKDMYEATTLYYQQGLDTDAAMGIANETMKMARIGGLEAADATDKMTAALRGFNMELNETSAQRVNDVYSNLAAKTASDTEELGTAMQRTASIAASAGMSFEGTAAFLAQAIETTREPAENLGTAMKTIVARFTELKKNPLEIAEVEGEEVDYNKVDTALKSIGVSLKDANGQFRDLDQVFLDISQRWDGLTQTQQRYVATTAAGSRQQSRFIAMMSNYERTLQLMDYANNSAGASNEQFGKTMESLEAKINKLKNAWDQFLMGIANDKAVKFAVDKLTSGLTAVNKIITTLSKVGPKSLEGINKSVLSIAAAFVGLKAAGKGINALISKAGGWVDPSTAMFGGQRNVGNGQGARLYSTVTSPIIGAIKEVVAAINKEDATANKSLPATLQEYKKAQSDLLKLTSLGGRMLNGQTASLSPDSKTIQYSDIANTLQGLSAEQQRGLIGSFPGLQTAMQTSTIKMLTNAKISKGALNAGTQITKSIIKGMNKGSISVEKGIELLRNPQRWGEYFGDQFSEGALKEIADSTFGREGFDKLVEQNKEAYLKANPKATKEELAARQGDFEKGAYRKIKQQGVSYKDEIDYTKYDNLADKIGTVGRGFATAGQSVQQFGVFLSSIGLESAGAAITNIGTAIMSLGISLNGVGKIAGKVTARVAAAMAATESLTGGAALKAFGSTLFKGLGPQLGIGLAAAVVGGLVLLHKHLEKKAQEAGQKVREDFEAGFTKNEEKISSIENLQDRFNELSRGVDRFGHNVSLSNEDYNEYLDISSQLAELSPSLIAGYDAEGKAILKKGEALDEVIAKLEEEKQASLDRYITDSSINDLIGEYKTSDAYKEYAQKSRTNKGEGEVIRRSFQTELAALSNANRKAKLDFGVAEAIQQLGGGEVSDLSNLTTEQMLFVSQHYNDILGLVEEKNGQLDAEVKEGLTNAFGDISGAISDVQSEGQPIIDAMQRWMGSEKLDAAGLKLGDEFANGFTQGFNSIMLEGLSKGWTDASQYKDALRDYAAEWKSLGGATSEYSKILDEASEKQDDYLDHIGEKGAVDDYKNSVEELAQELETLADKQDTSTQAGKIFAEQCIAQANALRNYATEGAVSLAEALNTLSDEFTSARGAKERFDKAIEGGDYYTAAEGYKGIIDTILDDKNLAGNGSLTFWAGADELLGKEFVDNNSYSAVVDQINKVKACFEDGADGVLAFNDLLVENADQLDGLGHVINGNDWVFDLQNEDLAEYAELLGMSEDALAALIDKARQWVPFDLGNLPQIRQALEQGGQAMVGQSYGENGKSNLYMSESAFRSEAYQQGIRGDDYTKTRDDLSNEQNVRFLTVDSLKANTGDLGLDNVLKDVGLTGADKTLDNAVSVLTKMGFDLEEQKQILSSDGIKLADGTATEDAIEKAYQEQEFEQENPTVAGIANDTGVIASAATAILASMGILTEQTKKDIDQSTSDENVKGYLDSLTREGEGFKNSADREAARANVQGQIDKYNETISLLEQSSNKEAVQPYIDKLVEARNQLQEGLDTEADSWKNKLSEASDLVKGIGKESEQAFLKDKAVDIGEIYSQENISAAAANLRQLEEEGNLSHSTMAQLATDFLQLRQNELGDLGAEELDKLCTKLGLTKTEATELLSTLDTPFVLTGRLEGDDLKEYINEYEGITTEDKTILLRTDISGEEKVELLIDKINSEFGDGSEQTKTIILQAEAKLASGDQASAEKLLTEAGFNDQEVKEITERLSITVDGSVANKGEVQQALTDELNGMDLEAEVKAKVSAKLEIKNDAKVSDQTASVNYKKGSQAKPEDKDATVNYSKIGTQAEPKDKSAGVSYTWKSQDAPKDKVAYVTYKERRRGQNYSIPAHQSVSFGAAADGMNIPKKKKSSSHAMTALVGEEGFEVAYIPSECRSMILGANGPEITSFPADTVIYPHKQSQEIVRRGKNGHATLGSFEYGTDNVKSGGLRSSVTKTTSTTDNTIKKLQGQKKQTQDKEEKNAKEEEKIIKKAGKITAWWENQERKLEAIRRAVEKGLKKVNKLLEQVGSTLKSVGKKGGDKYINKLRQQESLGNQSLTKAENELTYLDKGTNPSAAKAQKKVDKAQNQLKAANKKAKKAKTKKEKAAAKKAQTKAKTNLKKAKKELKSAKKKKVTTDLGGSWTDVSYEVTKEKKDKNGKKTKSKETKNATVNLAKYIKYDSATGTYVVDDAKINKEIGTKNKSKAKAVKEAADKEVNERLKRKYDAEDEIEKAQEALEELGQNLYDTFFGWENELTKIWNITQKIEESEARQAREEAYSGLLESQLASGEISAFNDDGSLNTNYLDELNSTFKKTVDEQVKSIGLTQDNIKAQAAEIQKTLSTEDESITLQNVQSLLKGSEAVNKLYGEAASLQSQANASAQAVADAQKDKEKAQADKKDAQKDLKAAKKTDTKKDDKKAKNEINAAKGTIAEANKTIKAEQKNVNSLTAAADKAEAEAKALEASGIRRLNETETLAYQTEEKQLADQIKIMETAKGYFDYKTNSDGTVSIDFKTEQFEADKQAGKITSADAEKIQEYVKTIVDQSSNLQETYKTLTDKLTELRTDLIELKDAWVGYSDDLMSYLESQQQAELDKLKALNDSINNYFKELIDKVKKNLELRRQQEDNAKTEKNISKKQQRLASLRADTSGGNAIEIAQLEQEIAEEQQSYQRTLEDQLLDRLQDQADQAAQQRERQIQIQEGIWSAVNNAATVNAWMNDPEGYKTAIAEAFYTSMNYDGVPLAKQEALDTQFGQLMTGMATNQQQQETLKQAINATTSAVNLVKDSMGSVGQESSQTTMIGELQKIAAELAAQSAAAKAAADEAARKAQDAANQAAATAQQTQAAAQKATNASNYNTAFSNAISNGKLGKSELNNLINLGSKDGVNKSPAQVAQQLANTDQISWTDIIKAAIDLWGKKTAAANIKSWWAGSVSDARKNGWKNAFGKNYPNYLTGGLANYTGPAWLDGTPSKPELVLNAQDTKNFIALKDVLSRTMQVVNSNSDGTYGNAVYEININVEKLTSDYDVDKVAERVKKIIVKDSSYRNVTQVRKFR